MWAVPVKERISEIETESSKSMRIFSVVCLVMLFCLSSTTTVPISSDTAKVLAAWGSDIGLSLFVWGYNCSIGWDNFKCVNGATDGELP